MSEAQVQQIVNGVVQFLAQPVNLALELIFGHNSSVLNLAFNSPIYRRATINRLYQLFNGVYTWTLPNESLANISAAIASLTPTYVSAFVRFESNALTIPANVISDFNTFRTTILASSPTCKFDCIIRAEQYTTTTAIQNAVQQAVAQLPNVDAIFFDTMDGTTPDVIAAGITEARSLGKIAGGDVGGTTQIFTVMPDFLAWTIASDSPLTLADLGAEMNPPSVGSSLLGVLGPSNYAYLQSFNVPLMLHVDNFAPDRTIFITNWTQQQRIQWITQASQMQSQYGFSHMYPTAFPEAPIGTAYDPIADGTVPIMQQLINQINPAP